MQRTCTRRSTFLQLCLHSTGARPHASARAAEAGHGTIHAAGRHAGPLWALKAGASPCLESECTGLSKSNQPSVLYLRAPGCSACQWRVRGMSRKTVVAFVRQRPQQHGTPARPRVADSASSAERCRCSSAAMRLRCARRRPRTARWRAATRQRASPGGSVCWIADATSAYEL